MSRVLQWLAALAAGIAVVLIVLAIQRGRLPYDSAGRYFDPQEAVIYRQQSVEVLTLAGIVALLAAGTSWQFARITRKRGDPAASRGARAG